MLQLVKYVAFPIAIYAEPPRIRVPPTTCGLVQKFWKLELCQFCLREAAKECRRKKKEYVKCLENRVAVLENQNKALIEELKTLKELYCRKEKGD